MLGTILEANPYLGRIITGRITSGSVKPNQAGQGARRTTASWSRQGRISKILAFRGLERTPIDEAEAGDIVAIAGLSKGTVADTFCDPAVDRAAAGAADRSADRDHVLPRQRLAARRHRRRQGDEPRHPRPPAAGSRRQCRAARSRNRPTRTRFDVSGRGELQLAILIETMRREGFELAVSRPRVVLQKDEATGELLEPIEEVVIDVDEEHSGVVVQKMSERKAEMIEMRPSGGNRLRLVFHAPTRGLIGYQSANC